MHLLGRLKADSFLFVKDALGPQIYPLANAVKILEDILALLLDVGVTGKTLRRV